MCIVESKKILLIVNKNGGFLVRDSKHGGAESPYTLTVFNEGKLFNINIRVKQDGQVALGKEKFEENVRLKNGQMYKNNHCQALAPSPVPLVPNPNQFEIQVQLGLG